MNITKINIFLLIIFFTILSCNENNRANTEKETPKPTEYTPEWSRNAIWYQIFPERFRNGDTTNDPRPKDILGTYPNFVPQAWEITPWGQDWYKPDDWFKNSSLKNKWDNLQLRRYGGDLQGIIDKLDYLQELGITAIYFNPLNDSPSLHKYDPRYWRHIDRNFGPNPDKDIEIINSETGDNPETWKFTNADKLFLKLIDECHKRNLKLIMDYSFNHTGIGFWALKDVEKNGQNSKYADWFEIESFDNPETEENEFKYKTWMNVIWMPEVNKKIIGLNNEMPYEGNLESESLKKHIFNVTSRWLDPNNDGDTSDGVDGFRLDVAAEVPLGFWRDFRKHVKKINPEAYLVGEIWWKSWPDELMFPHTFLKGDIFDAIMNYRWFRTARHFFAEAPDEMSVDSFTIAINDKLSGIETNRLQAMMNVTATHDSPRLLTSLYNKGKYKYNSKPYDNSDYKINKPDSETFKTQKMFLVHQFTFVGSPQIYYGEEKGMWGADDPDCRKPMIWEDINFEIESHHPFDKKRNSDEVKINTEIFNFYKQLIKIRKENNIFAFGDFKFIHKDNKNKTLAYSRTYKGKTAIVIFNFLNSEQKINLNINKNGNYFDAFNKKEIHKITENKVGITLESKGFKVLIKE